MDGGTIGILNVGAGDTGESARALATWSGTMTYIVRFTDGSQSPLRITGWDHDGDLIGIAVRGDGYKRVVFLTRDGRLRRTDEWIDSVRMDGADDEPPMAKSGAVVPMFR